MRSFPKSEAILAHNRKVIPGGVVSVNRSVAPQIVFTRADGAILWDAEGNTYIDYHAAFAPHFLGHNDPDVNAVVEQVLQDVDRIGQHPEPPASIEARLREVMLRFESEHPRLATTVGQVADALGKLGI